jgi:hypothetical protein
VRVLPDRTGDSHGYPAGKRTVRLPHQRLRDRTMGRDGAPVQRRPAPAAWHQPPGGARPPPASSPAPAYWRRRGTRVGRCCPRPRSFRMTSGAGNRVHPGVKELRPQPAATRPRGRSGRSRGRCRRRPPSHRSDATGPRGRGCSPRPCAGGRARCARGVKPPLGVVGAPGGPGPGGAVHQVPRVRKSVLRFPAQERGIGPLQVAVPPADRAAAGAVLVILLVNSPSPQAGPK